MIDLGLFRDVVASEWTKLRSVRSTAWTALAAVVLGIGLGAAISAANGSNYTTMTLIDQTHFDPTNLSLAGLFFSQLALGVMAILTVSAEYSTGMIRATLGAVPQRGYVLSAKALLTALFSMVLTLGIAFGSFFVGQTIFEHYGLSVSLHHAGVLRAVIGGALYMGGLALFAIGLATIIRHTAGAITALVGLVFILPAVTQALPDPWQTHFARYLPANAGSSILAVVPPLNPSTTLTPWTGLGVFMIWALTSLGAGWYLLRRRDV